MIQGIVFDLDGTLVDSLSATIEAFNQGILRFGGRRHTAAEVMAYFGPGESEILAKIVGPHNADAAYQASREYMDSHMGEIPLHDGVPELLDHLKSENIPISIFTGRSWDTTELILKHHRILDRFVTVVASDHVDFPKPAPEGLQLALSRMNIHPQNSLFVGDSHADMMASQAAGSHGVAALWDLLADRKAIEPYDPAHWAKHPSEIIEIYRTSNKN